MDAATIINLITLATIITSGVLSWRLYRLTGRRLDGMAREIRIIRQNRRRKRAAEDAAYEGNK